MKKYFTFVCIVLAFCAILGLNARVAHPQFKKAFENVNSSVNTLQSDLEFLHVYANILEDFNLEQTVEVGLETYEDDGSGNGEFYVIRVESGSEHEYTFYDYDTAKKLKNVLRPLGWRLPELDNGLGGQIIAGILGRWNTVLEAIGTVVYLHGVIISFGMFALMMILDTVLTVWSIVESAMYILGMPVVI